MTSRSVPATDPHCSSPGATLGRVQQNEKSLNEPSRSSDSALSHAPASKVFALNEARSPPPPPASPQLPTRSNTPNSNMRRHGARHGSPAHFLLAKRTNLLRTNDADFTAAHLSARTSNDGPADAVEHEEQVLLQHHILLAGLRRSSLGRPSRASRVLLSSSFFSSFFFFFFFCFFPERSAYPAGAAHAFKAATAWTPQDGAGSAPLVRAREAEATLPSRKPRGCYRDARAHTHSHTRTAPRDSAEKSATSAARAVSAARSKLGPAHARLTHEDTSPIVKRLALP
ncbi:hypothetical protein AOLI_G00295660 [Acnodon oligacanthus]